MAKAYAHFITINYRESYGLFACSGILFNHESSRRGAEFVTRKISHAVAADQAGPPGGAAPGQPRGPARLGLAGDYVEAMWSMLQQDEPDDYVIGTGETHSVRELTELAFGHVGLSAEDHVRTDSSLLRPVDVEHLVGDSSKARQRLGWEPRTRLPELVGLMVDHDLELLTRRLREEEVSAGPR